MITHTSCVLFSTFTMRSTTDVTLCSVPMLWGWATVLPQYWCNTGHFTFLLLQIRTQVTGAGAWQVTLAGVDLISPASLTWPPFLNPKHSTPPGTPGTSNARPDKSHTTLLEGDSYDSLGVPLPLPCYVSVISFLAGHLPPFFLFRTLNKLVNIVFSQTHHRNSFL